MSLPRTASADERVLLAHAVGVPLSRLALLDSISPDQTLRYQDLLARRAAGIPVQHLTGEAHFRTVSLAVGEGVFIPRPETEVLAQWVIDEAPQGARVVELCAGSGAISLSLATERPDLRLHAVELSDDALAYAERNLFGSGVELRAGDMADSFPDLNGQVDVVVANPPYVPLSAWEYLPAEVREHDPHLALFSGQDGLDALAVVAAVARRLLRVGGRVAAEHAEVQSHEVVKLVRDAGFVAVADHPDLNHRPRFVTGRLAEHGRMTP